MEKILRQAVMQAFNWISIACCKWAPWDLVFTKLSIQYSCNRLIQQQNTDQKSWRKHQVLEDLLVKLGLVRKPLSLHLFVYLVMLNRSEKLYRANDLLLYFQNFTLDNQGVLLRSCYQIINRLPWERESAKQGAITRTSCKEYGLFL